MSEIKVRDQRARALLRLGRTHQVDALAPFPDRPALDLWAFGRRPYVHAAGDAGAGFGFGADAALLKHLKLGLAADGADLAELEQLTEDDVTRDERGVTVKPAALAKLPPAIRAKLENPMRPPTLRGGFTARWLKARDALERAADADAFEYVDAGDGDVEQLLAEAPAGGVGLVRRSRAIAAPVRLTHISAHLNANGSTTGFSAWSCSPPGLGYKFATASLITTVYDTAQGNEFRQALNVMVLRGSVQLECSAFNENVGDGNAALVALSFTRLRRQRRSSPR